MYDTYYIEYFINVTCIKNVFTWNWTDKNNISTNPLRHSALNLRWLYIKMGIK
jgi:hypothetical protein